MTTPTTPMPATTYLTRHEGRIGYDFAGAGPLVVLVPGMGDLRASYRFLAPLLRDFGFAVASMDLRGHGDSDVTFGSYGDAETAGDIVALIDELGGPAFVVGNSMGAGAAVIAAADRPELVRGLVLVGPFVRNGETSAMKRAIFRLLMARPWAVAAWRSYLPKLYAGRRPTDFEAYRDALVAALHRPGYATAFSRTTRVNHDAAQARLTEVSVPVLVVMGAKDPDFPDPAAEAAWVAEALHGEVMMIDDAGHYPQSQQPEVTAKAVLHFLSTVSPGA